MLGPENVSLSPAGANVDSQAVPRSKVAERSKSRAQPCRTARISCTAAIDPCIKAPSPIGSGRFIPSGCGAAW